MIIGGGFGGLICAQALKRARVRITVVDRASHQRCQSPEVIWRRLNVERKGRNCRQ
ncbi:MAG: NAD(P)-binding protein [Blastocatellia bacterium]